MYILVLISIKMTDKELLDFGFIKGIISEADTKKSLPFVLRELKGRIIAEEKLMELGFTDIKQESFKSRWDITATFNDIEYKIEAKHRSSEYSNYMLNKNKYEEMCGYKNSLYLTTTETGKVYIWDITKPDEFKWVYVSKYTAADSDKISMYNPHYEVSSSLFKID